jgi:hypothetical protein
MSTNVNNRYSMGTKQPTTGKASMKNFTSVLKTTKNLKSAEVPSSVNNGQRSPLVKYKATGTQRQPGLQTK